MYILVAVCLVVKYIAFLWSVFCWGFGTTKSSRVIFEGSSAMWDWNHWPSMMQALYFHVKNDYLQKEEPIQYVGSCRSVVLLADNASLGNWWNGCNPADEVIQSETRCCKIAMLFQFQLCCQIEHYDPDCLFVASTSKWRVSFICSFHHPASTLAMWINPIHAGRRVQHNAAIASYSLTN